MSTRYPGQVPGAGPGCAGGRAAAGERGVRRAGRRLLRQEVPGGDLPPRGAQRLQAGPVRAARGGVHRGER